MPSQFDRTEQLIGKEALEKLKNARVAIFGIGGVRFFYRRSFSKSWHPDTFYL